MQTFEQTQTLHDRLNFAVGHLTYKQLGDITNIHPETVRRYMNGHGPSASFLSEICIKLGISGSWLLAGALPMKSADIPEYVLGTAGPDAVMNALSDLLIELHRRVDRFDETPESTPADGLKLVNNS